MKTKEKWCNKQVNWTYRNQHVSPSLEIIVCKLSETYEWYWFAVVLKSWFYFANRTLVCSLMKKRPKYFIDFQLKIYFWQWQEYYGWKMENTFRYMCSNESILQMEWFHLQTIWEAKFKFKITHKISLLLLNVYWMWSKTILTGVPVEISSYFLPCIKLWCIWWTQMRFRWNKSNTE